MVRSRPVYAVIRTGGKQERVAPGQRVRVERLHVAQGDEVDLEAVLVVDGERVLSKPVDLRGVVVSARVVGEELGPKVRGFTYKPKTNSRRRFGHRQGYDTIEITAISVPGQS